MDFVCKTFPRESFLRFNYAYMKSAEFQIEYNAFKCKVSEEPLKSQQFIRVHLCRNRGESEFPVTINDMLPPSERKKVETGQIMKYRNIGSYLKNQKEINSAVSILIVGSRAKREITKLGPTQFLFIIVANDDLTKEHLMKEFKGGEKLKITVATKESISGELNTLLERYALAPLKQICEECNSMLQHECNYPMEVKVPTLSSENFTHPGNKYRKIESNSRIKPVIASSSQCNGTVIPRKVDQTIRKRVTRVNRQYNETTVDQSQSSLGRTSFPHTVYTRLRSQNESKNTPNGFKYLDTPTESFNGKPSESKRGRKRIPLHRKKRVTEINGKSESEGSKLPGRQEQNKHPSVMSSGDGREFHERLLERVLALYGMSNVPKEDRPDVPEQQYNISEELRKDLFELCSTIKRMGYRYRTFYIYAVKPKSRNDETVRDKNIESVLKEHGIYKFKIATCGEHITELSRVGGKIEARSAGTVSLRSRTVCSAVNGGTLGCFVHTDEGERQCGLLSKHVCQACSEIYDVANGKNELIGHILPETNVYQDRSLDISAAVMENHIDEDRTKFIDCQGNRRIGKLYEYNEFKYDAICRSGQSVHIYGATSRPGKGEITMPFVETGLKTTLIQVEDEVRCDGKVGARFAQKGDSGAIVCVDDMNNDVHALSMVIGSPHSNPLEVSSATRRTYLTTPLSKGIQQLEDNTGKRFTLC